MKERERGDWATGGRGEYLRGYSRRVRWLAAWAAVSAWGHGDYLRGVFPGKQWRVMRVTVGGSAVPACAGITCGTVAGTGGVRALSYGYRRRR